MNKSKIFIFGLFLFLALPFAAHADNNLVVNSITVNPTNPAKNEPCTITINVGNTGDADLTDYTGLSSGDVTANFKDFTITKTTLPSLPVEVGRSMTYQYEGYFSSIGNKSLSFTVNVNNALPEAATGNNYLQQYVQIVEPYDYEINSINFYPSNPAVGEDSLIEVKATNRGFIALTTNQDIGDVAYSFPNFTIDRIEWPSVDYDQNKITTGKEYVYRYYGKFTTAGKSTYSYTLDSTNRVKEKNETNNTVSRDFEIYPITMRNLKIESVEYSVEKPLINEEFDIKVKVKNIGKVSVATKHGLALTEDNTLTPPAKKGFYYDLNGINLVSSEKDDYPTLKDPLDPNDVFTYTFTGKYNLEGKKTLNFEVDKNRQLSDADYSDNATTTSITIYKNATARDQFKFTDYHVDFISPTTAKFFWTTDQKSTGEVWYKQRGYTSFVGQTTSSNEDTVHSVQISDLKPGVNYEYTIIAKNGTEEVKVTDVFFTMPNSDIPTFSTVPQVITGNDSVKITWTTNLLTTSQVYYRVAGQSNYSNQGDGNLQTAHSLTITGLSAATYEYYVKATTSGKNDGSSDNKTFTIAAAPSTNNTNTNTSTNQTQNTNTDTQQSQTTTTNSTTANTSPIAIKNTTLYGNLKGKIVLTVESKGEAYYINPSTKTMSFLGRPADAFNVMRGVGVGITNNNLNQIQIGLTDSVGIDTDNDGLSDLLEDAIGTDKNSADTDKDGYADKAEIAGGHDPLKAGGAVISINNTFAKSQAGKIFLQIEGKGEAWYVNPADNKRYFLGRPADAFAVMRKLGLGISNSNFDSLQ